MLPVASRGHRGNPLRLSVHSLVGSNMHSGNATYWYQPAFVLCFKKKFSAMYTENRNHRFFGSFV